MAVASPGPYGSRCRTRPCRFAVEVMAAAREALRPRGTRGRRRRPPPAASDRGRRGSRRSSRRRRTSGPARSCPRCTARPSAGRRRSRGPPRAARGGASAAADRPGAASSFSSVRVEWQRAQVSTSALASAGFANRAVPRAASISQLRSRRSAKRTIRPGSLPALRPRARAALRPLDVARTGAVARLAGHVDLREGGQEQVVARAIALAQVRRVALGALAVPVLRGLRPVQGVAREVTSACGANQRRPPASAGRLSQAIPSTWYRPPDS